MGTGKVTAKREDVQAAQVDPAVADTLVQQASPTAVAAAIGGMAPTAARQLQETPDGNPGQADVQSQGDVDLSTSDNTARRRAGYRRDNGIRI